VKIEIIPLSVDIALESTILPGENRGRGLNSELNIGLSVFEYGGLRKKIGA